MLEPKVEARLLQELEVQRHEKALEIGTGSGYQTAVLAQLVDQVLSIERIRPLQDKARQRLAALALHNVRLRHADGHLGWPGEAGFDGILGAAAALGVPRR
mgnify:CR=1 FL=1